MASILAKRRASSEREVHHVFASHLRADQMSSPSQLDRPEGLGNLSSFLSKVGQLPGETLEETQSAPAQCTVIAGTAARR